MLLLLFLVTWAYFRCSVVITSSLYFTSMTSYFLQSLVQFFDVNANKISDLDILAKL